MKNAQIKTFLAANSSEGFISYFTDCYEQKDGWKAYIIKGGPGTGKSSFMKYVAVKAADIGYNIELCPCSSDPDSLDAVIIKNIKTVILDGTSPHTVDPVYPAISESILNFGEFWKRDNFDGKAEKIIEITDKNKALHKTASLYLHAAGTLLSDNYKTAKSVLNTDKLNSFFKLLSKKYFKNKNCNGKEQIRFLSGITPKGIVFFGDTVKMLCKEHIIIEDDFGCVADYLIKKIRDAALNAGYNIITVKNALLPQNLDGIIIPEISLCFIREYEYAHLKSEARRIHSRRFLDFEALRKSKEKIKFNKKAARELLLTAVNTLSRAKAVHDDLEKYYINAMDFKKLTEFANDFTVKILK